MINLKPVFNNYQFKSFIGSIESFMDLLKFRVIYKDKIIKDRDL